MTPDIADALDAYALRLAKDGCDDLQRQALVVIDRVYQYLCAAQALTDNAQRHLQAAQAAAMHDRFPDVITHLTRALMHRP